MGDRGRVECNVGKGKVIEMSDILIALSLLCNLPNLCQFTTHNDGIYIAVYTNIGNVPAKYNNCYHVRKKPLHTVYYITVTGDANCFVFNKKELDSIKRSRGEKQ